MFVKNTKKKQLLSSTIWFQIVHWMIIGNPIYFERMISLVGSNYNHNPHIVNAFICLASLPLILCVFYNPDNIKILAAWKILTVSFQQRKL